MRTLKVGVVGFGPAGCVVAMSLYRQGHDVRVYERDEDPFTLCFEDMKDKSYPVSILPLGSDVMRECGMLEHFQQTKYCNRYLGQSVNGSKILTHKGLCGYQGSRTGLMKTMLECVKETCPDLVIHFNCPITHVNLDQGEVVIDGNHSHKFDLIVGADGAGSVVRQNISEQREDINVNKFQIPQFGTPIYLDQQVSSPDHEYFVIFSLNPFFGACHLKEKDNEVMMGVVFGANQFANPQEARNYIRKIRPEIANQINETELQQFIKRTNYNLGRGFILSQFYSGKNAVLVGDAAHAYPPAGSGTGLAMRGALTFCEQFKIYNDDLEKGLESYSVKHKREADGAILLSTFHQLHYILLTTYFYMLGAPEHVWGILIELKDYKFEDMHTIYSTAFKIAKRAAFALLLAAFFIFALQGIQPVLRLAMLLCVMFGALNVWALKFKDVQDYDILQGVVMGVAGFSFFVGGILYLLLEFL